MRDGTGGGRASQSDIDLSGPKLPSRAVLRPRRARSHPLCDFIEAHWVHRGHCRLRSYTVINYKNVSSVPV